MRNLSGAITANNGPAMFFRPNLAGPHEVRLIIWDLYGRVAGTSASFQVENRTLIEHPFGGRDVWGTCGVSGGDPVPIALDHPDPFGSLDIQCGTNSCMIINGFHLRWRSTTVSTQSIGQCSYACGENQGTAVYDPCKGRYTKIIWRNEEGRRGYNHLGSICDYSAPAGADVDVYCFEPESNRLTIEHFRRLITWGGWSRGTDQSEGIYYDAPAPTDDTGLCDNRKHQLSRTLGLIALEMTGSGGTDGQPERVCSPSTTRPTARFKPPSPEKTFPSHSRPACRRQRSWPE